MNLSSQYYPSQEEDYSCQMIKYNLLIDIRLQLLDMMEVEEDGGYVEDFVEELHSRYECPICCLVLREPLQLQCGHRFCQTCFEKLPKRYRVACYFHLQHSSFNQFHSELN